ncbi:hypothetical protein WJX73_006086 [Symbiochloris irregularis]|uniref:Uncharacterized protein n=1 Tax=Symbiochloris irregularis TaxID=706552 RepID=A0AAW1NMC7_9CHLO
MPALAVHGFTLPRLQSAAQPTRSSPPVNRVVCAALQSSVVYATVPEGEELFVTAYLPESPSERKTNGNYNPQTIEVENARQRDEPFSLHEHGFTLADFQLPEDLELDWKNADQVKDKYYPLALQLVKDVSGATRVHPVEHIVRKGRARTSRGQSHPEDPAVMQPSNALHVDFTTESGPLRLEWALPEEYDLLQRVPFAIVQVWRPIVGPVDESPLAFVDVKSVSPQDLTYGRLVYPDKHSSFYAMKHNPGHEFYYYKGMTTSEAAVFKCYDSRTQGTARFTPHCSFHDPTTSDAAAERYSIEFRALAFFEEEG